MFDLVINNGSIIDPLDGEYESNIGISKGKIATISSDVLEGKKVIDLQKEKVVPGFIDIHMHAGEVATPYKMDCDIFKYMALMGVTTCVGGNCGLGDVELGDQKDKIINVGLPVNYTGFIGYGSLREKVGCSDRYRSANKNELKKMSVIVEDALKNGGLGVSFGLEYTPGVSLEELMHISKVVACYPHKLVSAHYRFDSTRSLEALAELIIIARETGVRLQISHINSCNSFGQMEEGLRMVDAAYEAGVDLSADAYPYDAFSTFVGSAVFDPGCFASWGVSYDAIEVCEGKYRGKRCTQEIFDDIRENEPNSLVVAFVMNEDEVIKAMQHPLVMVASDGYMKDGQGHPRGAGTFPRVLGKYVRESKCLDLVTAIKKMTMMPAERLGLKSKGRIKEGCDADITIFNSETIIDNATYQDPTKPPSGIEYVLVSGIEVVKNGELTGKLPGNFLNI